MSENSKIVISLICFLGMGTALYISSVEVPHGLISYKSASVFYAPPWFIFFICFLSVLLSILINEKWTFFSSAAPGMLISLWACYRFDSCGVFYPGIFEIPFCYFSFVLFFFIWNIKLFGLRSMVGIDWAWWWF